MKQLFAAFTAFALLVGRPGAQAPRPPDPAREKRLEWFREAKYGLFIHWGLYAIPAGEWNGKRSPGLGEWVMFRSRVPVKEYEQLASRFNPVKFNADEWVKVAKDAGMPAPAFGLQLVYTDAKEPEIATIVREGDVVLMPQGYHPNVAAPGGSINFLWMMAANREREDRQYGVVNVQPEFAATPSGLDKGR